MLLLLGMFFSAPVILGWIVYLFDWTPGTHGNHGELIGPFAIPESALLLADGRSLNWTQFRGKWVMVQFDVPRCPAYCERKLYFMRQVRSAQGENMKRVERLWVFTEPGAASPQLLKAIEGTRMVRSVSPGFTSAFPTVTGVRDHIYLVDPRGNLMMRYRRDPDPSGMIKDLKRLLKYSGIG